MFVCVSRVTLQIPESGSLKAKRQILRRVSDRVKARFNVSVGEVGELDLWQMATLALCVVGNDRRQVNEQMDKILNFIEQMYVAPTVSREMEILSFGDRLFGDGKTATKKGHDALDRHLSLKFDQGERSLAEAEGMGDWADVYRNHRQAKGRKAKSSLKLEEARARARLLRNPRDWEKK